MKLQEMFDENPDTIFHVGALSGFIFIGNAEKFSQDIKKLNANAHLDHAKRKIKKQWIDLQDRFVIEVYDRISDDGKVIIIEGTESGRFWNRKEYENHGVKKN